jgi:hypothetical protein
MPMTAAIDPDPTACEPVAEPPALTDQPVATAYLMTIMKASAHGHGFDAAGLRAQALATQRGDPAARRRLFSVFRPRQRLLKPPRLRAPRRRPGQPRPRRRACGGSRARARSPGREDPEPPAAPAPVAAVPSLRAVRLPEPSAIRHLFVAVSQPGISVSCASSWLRRAGLDSFR